MKVGMARPVFVIMPGAWHSPIHYGPLVSRLTSCGCRTTVLPVQAVIQQTPVSDLEPDIAALRAAVISEIEAENDVIVVAHSWGGIVATGALTGLKKTEREQVGVIRIIYLCAIIPLQLNLGMLQALGGELPDWYIMQGEWVTPKNPTELFYNDLPAAEAEHWASHLRPQSILPSYVGVQSLAWKDIPSAYLITERDSVVSVTLQETLIDECKKAGAKMEVKRIESGHSPYLSQTEKVAAWLVEIADEKD